MITRRLALGIAVSGLMSGAPALASAAPKHRKPDLADAVEGDYSGDVISDSAGPSKDDVAVTVRRTGRNLVEITSDYGRLPTVSVGLTSAMGKILNARGETTFLYDRSKSPPHLDISFNGEVSWSGERR